MRREVKSFQNAWQGIFRAAKLERHLKFHIVAAIGTIAGAFILQFSALEWVVLVLTISGMIALELVNTAVERIVDFVQPEWDERAGQIKDIAAGACLIYACGALAIGCILYIPKLIEVIS
ncbi:diacylglycerol kinase family protein [Chryseomicrobium palamuruense]